MEKQIEVLEDQTVKITTTNETTVVETHTPDEIQRQIDVLTLQLQEETEKRQTEIDSLQAIMDKPEVQTAIAYRKANPIKVVDASSTPSVG